MWAGVSAVVVFLAVWAWGGSFFWAAMAGSFLLGVFIEIVDKPPRDSQDGSPTSIPRSSGSCPGLLGIVLMLAGLSWLFGGGDGDCDC